MCVACIRASRCRSFRCRFITLRSRAAYGNRCKIVILGWVDTWADMVAVHHDRRLKFNRQGRVLVGYFPGIHSLPAVFSQ